VQRAQRTERGSRGVSRHSNDVTLHTSSGSRRAPDEPGIANERYPNEVPMNADGFRKLALGFPDTAESRHMNHPDFRRAGNVFATLGAPSAAHAMVKLTPEEQAVVMGAHPDVFVPAAGKWGTRGATLVQLRAARAAEVRAALELAWTNAAPKPRRSRRPA
jgi:hypothetical protein